MPLNLINCDEKEIIYEGNSIVFRGKYRDRDVAVKRMTCTEETGEDALKTLKIINVNVVELLCVEQSGPFR